MSGRPVFELVAPRDGHRVYRARLPRGLTLSDALSTIESMVRGYQPGMFVYEEVWHGRGGAAPDEGGLTHAEVEAILSGDVQGITSIKVARFLWRVVALEPGRAFRIEHGRQLHSGSRESRSWTMPSTVVLVRCDNATKHRVTLDEIGIRFSRPYTLDLPSRRRLNAMAAAYNRADDNWRRMWLDMLWADDVPLAKWTTSMQGFVPLLTLRSVTSVSALTWWGDDAHSDDDSIDSDDDSVDEEDDGCRLVRDPKMLVPPTSTCSLATLTRPAGERPSRPTPIHTKRVHFSLSGANPFEMYRSAAGGIRGKGTGCLRFLDDCIYAHWESIQTFLCCAL